MIAKRLYNEAKAILTQAGSKSAGAAHLVHDDVEEHVGRRLLTEAEAEFTARSGGRVTAAQGTALLQARTRMGL